MPIDFRCNGCGKLLRTADDTAGRPAQCPECGALTTVPTPGATPGPQVAPLAPLGAEAPTATGPASGGPFPEGPETRGTAGSGKPYDYAYAYSTPPAQRVSGPATALMVIAILGTVTAAISVVSNAIHMVVGGRLPFQAPPWDPHVFGALYVTGGTVQLAAALVVLLGAIKMKNLDNYAFAMTAAVLATIPCTSPCCCLLGMPFGIWALVVLNDRLGESRIPKLRAQNEPSGVPLMDRPAAGREGSRHKGSESSGPCLTCPEPWTPNSEPNHAGAAHHACDDGGAALVV